MTAVSSVGLDLYQNADVIRRWTVRNVAVNRLEDAALTRAKFYAGDWRELARLWKASATVYNLVLMAETIYSPASFPALIDLLVDAVAPGGQILLASKVYYFGVGGCVCVEVGMKCGG